VGNSCFSLNAEWRRTLTQLLAEGAQIAPRGKPTLELSHHTINVDMRFPVLTVPERRLSYRFMVAEAYWILTGDNSVAGIAPWNERIAQFSDNGQTFFGAYGPRIAEQMDYVVDKLRTDRETRQACLTIWRPNPPPTKDYPCTVAVVFSIRDGRLSNHVFMRSNDVWLGMPYDVFNFSMLAHLVCCWLNHGKPDAAPDLVSPGTLYLTAASSHLYEEHWPAALVLPDSIHPSPAPTPRVLHLDEASLLSTLRALRDSSPGHELRWWE